jgi:hypothetical protein
MADVSYSWWDGPPTEPPKYFTRIDEQGRMCVYPDPASLTVTGGTMSGDYDTIDDLDGDDDIVIDTFNELEEEIDIVDTASVLERELDAEEAENARLRSELAAEKGVDRTATEIKRDWLGRPKVDETTYKNHLDLPVEEKVFTVHGKNFHSYNEALQFEVLTDLKNKTFAFDRYGFEDHAIEAEDNKPYSVENLGEFCIPLDCLAQNIDEISLILREYQQKKQR